jgi:hypothetical protein
VSTEKYEKKKTIFLWEMRNKKEETGRHRRKNKLCCKTMENKGEKVREESKYQRISAGVIFG